MPLPIELVTLILARLPVKSLSRFKSVSKEWYFLIKTPFFIDFHKNHSPPGGNIDDRHLIVVGEEDNRSAYSKYRSSPHIECRSLNSHLTSAVKFDIPLFSDATDQFFDVCCSCNGLVIIHRCYKVNRRENRELIMWNPLSNNFFLIPFPYLPAKKEEEEEEDEDDDDDEDEDCFYFGLGYDKSINDYKLVMFSYINNHSYSRYIYSSKRNCWGANLIEDTGHMNHYKGHNALIDNHIIHWLFKDRHTNQHDGRITRLRGFDICLEQWRDVPLPDTTTTQGYGKLYHLGILDNCLCITNKYGNHDDPPLHVWVMKEYGVKESWIKLFSLSTGVMWTRLFGPPVAYSMRGDEIAMRIGCQGKPFNVIWYNLKDKTWTMVGRCKYMHDITHCVASLVPDPIKDKVNAGCFIKKCGRKTSLRDQRIDLRHLKRTKIEDDDWLSL